MFRISNALQKPPIDPSIIIDVAVSMFAPQPSAFLRKSLRSFLTKQARLRSEWRKRSLWSQALRNQTLLLSSTLAK